MAKSKITVEMDGDEAKLFQSFQRVMAGQNATERGYRRVHNTSKQAMQQGISMAKSLAGALGITGGVAGAVMILRKEWESMTQAQERSFEATKRVADSQIEALRNAGFMTAQARQEAEKAIAAMADLTKVPMSDLYQRYSTAVSSGFGLSQATILAAVRESAFLAPESAEKGTAIAGAALGLAQVTGIEDPRKNLALLMAIGQTAKVADIGALSQYAAPAVLGVSAYGDTARQAGALWSALTQGMGDVTGRRASTAAIALAEQLAEALPEKSYVDYKKVIEEDKLTGRKLYATVKGTGLKTTEERLAYMQAHPEAAAEFFSGASFDTKAKAAVRDLLTGKGFVAGLYGQMLQAIPTPEAAAPLYEQRLAVQRGAPMQVVAEMVRGLQTTQERLQTLDPYKALAGAFRRELETTLADTDMGWLAAKMATFSPEEDPEAYTRQMRASIKQRYLELKAPKELVPSGSLLFDIMHPKYRERAPSEAERREAEILGNLYRTLGEGIRRLEEEQKESNRLLREANSRAPVPKTLAAPDARR